MLCGTPMTLARLTIDLDALSHNHATLREHAGGAEVAPVIKANGYGLGAQQAAYRLWDEGARSFAKVLGLPAMDVVGVGEDDRRSVELEGPADDLVFLPSRFEEEVEIGVTDHLDPQLRWRNRQTFDFVGFDVVGAGGDVPLVAAEHGPCEPVPQRRRQTIQPVLGRPSKTS